MLVSLSKDQSSQPGEILAHVEISASDDPTKLKYSHSFRYKVPSGKDGEIVVYANKKNASKDVKGDVFLFDLEKCRNKDCKTKNPDVCPVIAGKGSRLLVADVFHTMPTQNTLQQFGMVLFKALFSYVAGLQLQETKSTHQNDTILLQLNDQDLDAIPWEYANDGATFLAHSHKFARIFGRDPKIRCLNFRYVSSSPRRTLGISPNRSWQICIWAIKSRTLSTNSTETQ